MGFTVFTLGEENRLNAYCEQNAQFFTPPVPQVDLLLTARKIEEQSWQGATSQVLVPYI
jgi:hypothetical protein